MNEFTEQIRRLGPLRSAATKKEEAAA